MSSRVPVLFVTWQAPESRRFHPIARVLRLPSGEFEWAYLRAVREAIERGGFRGLPGFEDVAAARVGPELPALFAHRVPARPVRRSASRPRAANDVLDPAPITLLVPVGQGQHERLEVFSPPLPAPLGGAWGVFAARGVGRVPGSQGAVDALAEHDVLRLVPEPSNAFNPHAVLLARSDGGAIGYLPDYLANELAEALGPGLPELAARVRVEVASLERIHHPPAEPLVLVSCRYTCDGELAGRLFHSERYRPLAPEAHAL
jgi:HIRAN domain-containing protein